MNTKNTKLVWRLKEQPTTESLRELVKDKILTNEEAREMLFSSEDQIIRDAKSLEAEIKFLRELVEKLSSRSQIVEIIKEIKVPYYNQPWYQPYWTWCGTTTIGSGSANTMLVTNASANISGIPAHNTANFSNIKTF
jgi:hypothetical protein